MKSLFRNLLLFIFTFCLHSILFSQEYVESKPLKGKGVKNLLEHYQLNSDSEAISVFASINGLDRYNPVLLADNTYKLPIRIFVFNGVNIRTTINNPDYETALSVQHFNEELHARSLKPADFRKDNQLWVPLIGYMAKGKSQNTPLSDNEMPIPTIEATSVNIPLFGKDREKVEFKSNKLKDVSFYLVAGHGGPDPGAIGSNSGYTLHEDEYAYDVILRLAERLIQEGAHVEVIIEDPDDGIREEVYLSNSYDETCDGASIPLNQLERLKQRVDRVNSLYQTNSGATNRHHFISIHVDSRASKQSQIDIFFYHAQGSVEGERIADALRDKIEDKYNSAQPGRGYKGSVSPRGLYVIRKSMPVATFIELGNIQNPRDQKRILQPDNRQAIANWLTEGLLDYYSAE